MSARNISIRIQAVALLGALASSLAMSAALAEERALCEARLVQARTDFPAASQTRGEGGTARVAVVLGESGQVLDATLVKSTGSARLDRAAVASVRQNWKFDVSHCLAAALPVRREVDVVYRRVPKVFSAAIDRRGIEYAKRAATDTQCAVMPDAEGHVISCILRPTAGDLAASDLARDAR